MVQNSKETPTQLSNEKRAPGGLGIEGMNNYWVTSTSVCEEYSNPLQGSIYCIFASTCLICMVNVRQLSTGPMDPPWENETKDAANIFLEKLLSEYEMWAGKCHCIFARFTNSVVVIISIYNGLIYIQWTQYSLLAIVLWENGGGWVIKPLLTVEPEISPLDNSSTRSGSG